MTNGSNHPGSIHVGDLDTWTFSATAGDAIMLAIGEVGPASDFQPWIRLKSPTGQNLGSQSGVLAAQIDATATVTGTYTVVVGTFDAGLDATSDYTLTLARAPAAYMISPGDEGGPLSAASSSGNGFIHVGDLDVWTFTAHAGDPINVTISEVAIVSPDFTPWIRLRGPTGQALGSQSGATGAQINVNAPATGIYTVVVSTFDAGLDGSGDYVLSVAGITSSMIRNGDFASGEQFWQFFATPTLAYIVHQVVGGVLQYYRVPPPPGSSNQAVAYQETGVSLPAMAPVLAQFDLANTSTVRKRISVLILDADFSDLHVCTFWLEANAPMRTYRMRTHTIEAWTNTALYFYAASAGMNGGYYEIDNVSMAYVPEQADDRTDCVDPTTPAPPGGASGSNLLTNGDFNTGTLNPWFTFGTITTQITGGVLEFLKATSTAPAGVVAQPTGQTMTAGDIITATFQLGNSSAVRKRVTVILHDSNFSDLAACTFWLLPGQSLSDYVVRTWATKAWADAMVSIYPATVGTHQWILADNVTLQRTPAASTFGTDCVEPGAESAAVAEAVRQTVPAARPEVGGAVAPAGGTGVGAIGSVGPPPAESGVEASIDLLAPASGAQAVTLAGAIDLSDASVASLAFDSVFVGAEASSARAAVQVSLDGRTWLTAAEVPAIAEWTPMAVDLSAYAGRVIRVRFVVAGAAGLAFDRPARWRIREVSITIR
jgi:hypothetical protein